MTLGNAAAARLRLIVWCLDCRHQVEPDPAEMAERYGARTTVPDWHARLVCSRCGSRSRRYGRDRDRAAIGVRYSLHLNSVAPGAAPVASRSPG
jgi:hypothetical protein